MLRDEKLLEEGVCEVDVSGVIGAHLQPTKSQVTVEEVMVRMPTVQDHVMDQQENHTMVE